MDAHGSASKKHLPLISTCGGGVRQPHLEGVGPAVGFVIQHLEQVASTLLRGSHLLVNVVAVRLDVAPFPDGFWDHLPVLGRPLEQMHKGGLSCGWDAHRWTVSTLARSMSLVVGNTV